MNGVGDVDVADVPAVGDVHGAAFGDVGPACTAVVVAGLVDDRLLVETEAEAVVGSAAGGEAGDPG